MKVRSKRRFAVTVCCFGDYPAISLECIRSLVEGSSLRDSFELHVGANQCSRKTSAALRQWYAQGVIDTLIESRENLQKDPMKRLLFDSVQTEYILWMDDDSLAYPGWDGAIIGYLDTYAPFDLAGVVRAGTRHDQYRDYLERRPWFRSYDNFSGASQHNTLMALGAYYLVRTEFVRRHGYPDKAMLKKWDDSLLGDLVAHENGKLLNFTETLDGFFERGDDVPRRGSGGEGPEALLVVDPITGF